MKLIGEVKMGFESLDPILGKIATFSDVHRGKTRQVSQPNILDTDDKLLSEDFIIELDWFRKTDVEKFCVLLWKFSESAKSQMKVGLFKDVDETTKATQNIINVKGLTLWESYIKTLKKWDIQFDEDDNPLLEDIGIYNSYTQERIEVSAETPEQREELDRLIQEKRLEFHRNKRQRRLTFP
jgi:hypothetical protein